MIQKPYLVINIFQNQYKTTLPLEEKVSKLASGYMPFAPIPPLAFIYECRTCSNYLETTKQCTIVSEVGTPDNNTIEPNAFCFFWLWKKEAYPLDYIFESLKVES